jgi:light-regulated signal transduction histidine kinase (bacteriophytochrome)
VIDEEMDKNLDKIVRASERMQLLINDLLRFSRNSTSNEDFSLINLNLLINDVLADLEIDVESTEAQFKIDQLPQIWGVASQMRQLFQNLVSNAIKFSKKGEMPFVHIYPEIKPVFNGQIKDNDFCRIVVQDNGIGFDQKFANEIFVVFKRLHSYHEFEGSGVGLSICKKIVERHHGFITAESKIDAGSKFIIDLPVAKLNTTSASRFEAEKTSGIK